MTPVPNKSEIRKSYLLNKYVIITPGRAKRPRDIKEQTIIERTASCPFCSENIDKNNIVDEIKKGEGKQVISLHNIFPAVTLDNDKAYGAQEVIVETPNHTKELGELEVEDIQLVLEMFKKRTLALSRVENIDYILCFKNQGSKAGASIVHAHSQIFATNIIPPDVHEEMGLAQSYKVEHGTCAYCDIIQKEMRDERKIFENKEIAAFAPYASEYHYEAWVFTKRHLDNITALNEAEASSLAKCLKKILTKLHSLDLSFNMFMHQVISKQDQHFYIKIQPRDSIWAGVELGSGLVINSISPELAAEYFRE
jgi:UDPglucose--hexose-1-phosphate uridylyltransferase